MVPRRGVNLCRALNRLVRPALAKRPIEYQCVFAALSRHFFPSPPLLRTCRMTRAQAQAAAGAFSLRFGPKMIRTRQAYRQICYRASAIYETMSRAMPLDKCTMRYLHGLKSTTPKSACKPLSFRPAAIVFIRPIEERDNPQAVCFNYWLQSSGSVIHPLQNSR